MTDIAPPYSKLPSAYGSCDMKELKRIMDILFPLIADDQSCKISTLMITTSFGWKTLILFNDTKSPIHLPPLSDPMELLPVLVYNGRQIKCTQALAEAISKHGHKIANLPTFVALQIGCESSDCRQEHISIDLPNNQLILAHAIINDVNVKIGDVYVSKMSPTWQAPTERPQWQGLSFEQSNRVIRTWIQTTDYSALERLSDNLDQLIQLTKSNQQQILSIIEGLQNENRYHGQTKKILSNQVKNMDETLTDYTKYRHYVIEENVSPTSTLTLQCAITAKVDSPKHLKLLNAYYCQKLIDSSLRSINDFYLQNITLEIPQVEKLISQIIKAIDKKLPMMPRSSMMLTNNNRTVYMRPYNVMPTHNMITYGTNPNHDKFADTYYTIPKSDKSDKSVDNIDWDSEHKIFSESKKWSSQTFAEFCNSDEGKKVSDEELQLDWQNSFNKKLESMIDTLKKVNKQLIHDDKLSFTDDDKAIYDNLYATIVEPLERGDTESYRQYLELNQVYEQYKYIREVIRSRNKGVHLIKRIASNGEIYNGVTKPSTSRKYLSDPNECLKEVHIPFLYSVVKN